MQRQFLYWLKLITDVKSYFIILVGGATYVISDVRNYFLNSFLGLLLGYFLHRLFLTTDVE